MVVWRSPRRQFLLALLFSSVVSLGLFVYGAWRNHSFEEFSYLSWNLGLAWLPLLFALRLMNVLKRKLWSSWEALSMSILWLVFLPNSFYMISDFIHLEDVRRVNILFDTLMFTSFIYTGVALGFSSLYLIHTQLRRRLSKYEASFWVAVTLFLSSSAMYLGRDLRWNSWDVLTNPGGLLFDVSDRLLHPSAYPQMILSVVVFFIVLVSTYNLLWRGVSLLRLQALSAKGIRYVAFSMRDGGSQHPLFREHLIYQGHCLIPGNIRSSRQSSDHEVSAGHMPGNLYKLRDLQILSRIDEYEDSEQEHYDAMPSRVLTELIKPRILAWVYFYNGNDSNRR